MANLIVVLMLIVFGATHLAGQTSVSDLKPSHAAALKGYLSEHQDRSFRQETILSEDYLKSFRNEEGFGKSFKPNYSAADFNGDGSEDFAVLLNREGKEEWPEELEEGQRTHSEHFPDHPLTLLVFNGIKGGKFRLAFSKDLMGPNAAFINLETRRRKKVLYYGIFESDADTFSLSPAGRGYAISSERPD